MASRQAVRRFARGSHLWLGLVGGVFVCLISVSGAIVSLRPPLAEALAPPAVSPELCDPLAVDWVSAEEQIRAFTPQAINRIYAFSGNDTRLHVRLMTSTPAIYDHLIYDACAGHVSGVIALHWMDWLVDLHHNLLAGRAGRTVAGAFGLALLLSAMSGFLVWLLGRPDLRSAFQLRRPWSGAGARDWHRAVGLVTMCVLSLEAYTGLWLCFPDAMRATLAIAVRMPADARAPRAKRPASALSPIGLAVVMSKARQAMPDGRAREVRLPEGDGNVQIRMWRSGDFRSLGNNVVSVSNVTGEVLAVDRYSDKTGPQRFVQAMAGLHYGDWGGLAFRWIYFAAGVATLLLFVTGLLIWWRPVTAARRLRAAA